MRTLALAIASMGLVLAACSTEVVDIHAESTSGSTSRASGVGGSGGHGGFGGDGGLGGHGGQGGHGGMMLGAGGAGGATSSSTGTGAGGAMPARVITADNDIAQLVSGVALGHQKLVDGPFVLTDVHTTNGPNISVVVGTDCAPAVTRHQILGAASSESSHGMRCFVPAGSAVCNDADPEATFSGFRPY